MGPIEKELRDILAYPQGWKWAPLPERAHRVLTDAAGPCALVPEKKCVSCTCLAGLECDMWSEALEAAEALGL